MATRDRAALERVVQLARLQDGVVSRAQCMDLGMTAASVRWMVQSRRWNRVHRAVFVTHSADLAWRTRLSAALLACGPGAVASHLSAARLHGLIDQDPPGVHVLVPESRRVVKRSGVTVVLASAPELRTARTSWPARTTVEDTVIDLAARGSADQALAWLARACQQGRTTPARIAAALARRPRQRRAQLLREVLTDVAEGAESPLESRYIRRVERAHRLPVATRQRRSVRRGRGRRDDNAYEAYRVLVEVDGQAGHAGAGTLRDRRRDNEAAVDGWVTLRFGWASVSEEPCATAADVARVLIRRGWTGRLRPCGTGCQVPTDLF